MGLLYYLINFVYEGSVLTPILWVEKQAQKGEMMYSRSHIS